MHTISFLQILHIVIGLVVVADFCGFAGLVDLLLKKTAIFVLLAHKAINFFHFFVKDSLNK
jgi:hypothetical protein